MLRSTLRDYHFTKLMEYHIERQDADSFICFQYKKGETIFLEGMPMEYLFLVVKGKAKVCVSTENGKDFLLSRYVSNGIIGDVELMTDSYVTTTSIITISDFECIGIPYQIYAKKLKSNAEFLSKVGYELARKLVRTTMSCKGTALYSGEARLCACLLETAEKDICNVTLTDLASSVGISYRHVQRIVKQLCEEEIVSKVKGGYQIIDRGYLEEKVPESYME